MKTGTEFPLVSIGMPIFNGIDYINMALENLLSQTYQNFELIISDNCSTDSSYEICQLAAFKDKRIRLFRQSHNTGPLNNFEFVVRQAQGKYYMWAAHDDIWDLNWLSIAVAGFNNRAVMVTSEITGINDANVQISIPLKFEFIEWRIFRLTKYFLLPESHGKANIIYSLFRTDIAKSYKFPGLDGFHGFDMHFVFFMLGKGECVFVEGKAMYKRVPEIRYVANNKIVLSKIYEVIRRNCRYLYIYINVSEGVMAKLTITLLMPLKLLSILWYGGQSVLRRYLKDYKL